MKQGKLDMAKEEVERVSIDILGISELKRQEWVNLTQVTVLSTTVGKNPLEVTEYPSQSTKHYEMQYLGAVSKMTEWDWFISKVNHSISTLNQPWIFIEGTIAEAGV